MGQGEKTQKKSQLYSLGERWIMFYHFSPKSISHRLFFFFNVELKETVQYIWVTAYVSCELINTLVFKEEWRKQAANEKD